MRHAIIGVTLLLAACYPSHPTVVPQLQQRQQQLIHEASINTHLGAFGGELIGTDNGEWGGSVSFRTAAGVIYTVVPENSHGIYAMPYGVVALTGLAHLTHNEGAVYALSQGPDERVEAKRILQLPGAPCDVLRQGDRITMRILTGFKHQGRIATPVLSCFSLTPNLHLEAYACPKAISHLCWG